MVKESKYNPKNEEIKLEYKDYLSTLKKDKVKESTAKAKIASINLFDEVNGYIDFSEFSSTNGERFYTHLRSLDIGPSTRNNYLTNVKDFLYWYLNKAKVKGKKQKIIDLDSLEPTLTDKRLANRQEIVDFPTDEEIDKIFALPAETMKEKRDRALIAFLILTASRISAAATATLKLVDLDKLRFYQDPLEGVHTKFDNYIITQFMEFNPECYLIVADWINTLKNDYGFDDASPLFPKIKEYAGHTEVEKTFIKDTAYNKLIEDIETKAGIEKYNPHAFRHYSIYTALEYARNGLQLKALSQNVGHAELETILEQYANMKPERYTVLIKDMFTCNRDLSSFSDEELIKELLKRQKTQISF